MGFLKNLTAPREVRLARRYIRHASDRFYIRGKHLRALDYIDRCNELDESNIPARLRETIYNLRENIWKAGYRKQSEILSQVLEKVDTENLSEGDINDAQASLHALRHILFRGKDLSENNYHLPEDFRKMAMRVSVLGLQLELQGILRARSQEDPFSEDYHRGRLTERYENAVQIYPELAFKEEVMDILDRVENPVLLQEGE